MSDGRWWVAAGLAVWTVALWTLHPLATLAPASAAVLFGLLLDDGRPR